MKTIDMLLVIVIIGLLLTNTFWCLFIVEGKLFPIILWWVVSTFFFIWLIGMFQTQANKGDKE